LVAIDDDGLERKEPVDYLPKSLLQDKNKLNLQSLSYY
jgi:hypothetical protein